MNNIRIREAGLRDGFQMISEFVPTEKKIELCKAIYRAGIREFDLTSFVPAKLLPQFSDAAEMVDLSNSLKGMKGCVLTPNLKGVQRAVQSGAQYITYILSASEAHNWANLRRTTEDSLNELIEVAAFLKSEVDVDGVAPQLLVGLSTAFGCTIQGDVEQSHVLGLLEKISELGISEITLADTVGYADPASVKKLFSEAKSVVSCDIAAHFHDTRGLGLANVISAMDVGIDIFDSSMGGLGGCAFVPGAAGNVATENLVYMLTRMGINTGVDMEQLLVAREVMENFLPDLKYYDHISKAGLPINF